MRLKPLIVLTAWMLVSGFGASGAGAETPRSWENRAGIPPVGDQKVAGSCYGWAAAYYYLTHLQWKDYGWDVTDPAHQCSPAFVYNLTNGGVDNGAWEGDNARADAFRLFETMGCATMADMPYDYMAYRTFPAESAFRSGLRFRTLSTRRISVRTDEGVEELKAHLAEGDLAVLGIIGYGNLTDIGPHENTYCASEVVGRRLFWHDVTLVGYDDARSTADGAGAFRAVNSWGQGWGDRGYFWISYEAAKSAVTSSGYALYAVDRTRYQPELTARIRLKYPDRYNAVISMGLRGAGGGTLLSFFDFHPMSTNTGVPFPDSGFVLDLTDFLSAPRRAGSAVSLRVENRLRESGATGEILTLELEYTSTGELIIAKSTPFPIYGGSQVAELIIPLLQ